MVSSIHCPKTEATFDSSKISSLMKRLQDDFEGHWNRLGCPLSWFNAIQGDDLVAYYLQEHLNTFVSFNCPTEEDERIFRFALAKNYVGNYLALPAPMWGDKDRRCALWRWMVCMGRHLAQHRFDSKTIASLAETEIYCLSMVQFFNLDWSEEMIINAAKSYVELNQRR